MLAIDIATDHIDLTDGALQTFLSTWSTDHQQPALSDHLRLDLRAAATRSIGFAGLIARRSSGIVGYAQLSTANDGAVLEIVTNEPDVERTLLADALAIHVHRSPGAAVTWWVDDPTQQALDVAADARLSPDRALHEMRRPLPHPQRSRVTTRAFIPGQDDEAWIRVNNRAFADHGEQGGWTVADLTRRFDEPWFDPDGFRMYEVDGELVGFCWTKVHRSPSALGEIYVVAVDPSAHGQGLGKQLTLAGLDWLADHGLPTANLFVDAGNRAAVALYDRLGFAIHRTRHAIRGVPDA